MVTKPALCVHVAGRGRDSARTRIDALNSCLEMAKPTAAATSAAPSYEQALAELDRLVQAMESGQMPLDQLLDSYRRGAELLQLCHARLEAVEAQVQIIENGQLKPWTTP